jgi:pyruvate dehydrogenase E1 component alpha subunit
MPGDDVMVRLHRQMVLGRRFDTQATALTRQGRLAVYPSARGQEAGEIGAVAALRPQDWLFPPTATVWRWWRAASTRSRC